MHGAGIRQIGGPVEILDLPDPDDLASDEVLIEVEAAGVGNWDEIVRTGGWDTGAVPPMALGVQAAGTIVAIGQAVHGFRPGDPVLAHPLPLRAQGTWADRLVAWSELVVLKPPAVPWLAAAALPVPALTAEQVLTEALAISPGEFLLVHGAGGVTGRLMVQLAALRGAHIIATAGSSSAQRVRELGACEVLSYHETDWPERVRQITGGKGVMAAANAARSGAASAMQAVADGGRLATITSDPPDQERDIKVSTVYVRPDAPQLASLVALLADGHLSLDIGPTFPMTEAGVALERAAEGGQGGAVVLTRMG
jgi:NADPH:quinone reductase-like Zn-dependent oxidoreductase